MAAGELFIHRSVSTINTYFMTNYTHKMTGEMEAAIEPPADREERRRKSSFLRVMCYMCVCKVRHFEVGPSSEVWSLKGATFNRRGGGPFHFLSPGSPLWRQLRGFDFFSFPPLTPFLVGVQECGRGRRLARRPADSAGLRGTRHRRTVYSVAIMLLRYFSKL